MFLVVHLVMSGRFLPDVPVGDPRQPKPYRLEARLFAPGLDEAQYFGYTIRPDGWKVPAGCSQVAAERGGYSDPPSQSPTPLPVGPLSNLSAFAKVTRHVIVHNRAKFTAGIATWRAQCGRSGPWISHAHETFDTAEASARSMGITDGRLPSLEEATTHLFGAPLDGPDGVLALYNALAVVPADRRFA